MHTSRISRLTLLAVLAGVVAAASIAPAASAAAQRYASPSGSGDCSSASPCSITQAVNGANAGDEVIVTPGDYPLTATLFTPAPITIHGVAGQPRPRLMFSGVGQGGVHLGQSTLRYLEVDQAQGQALRAYNSSKVDQVIARAPGTAASIQNSTITNSIVVNPATNGTALDTVGSAQTSTSTYRNVTAIATGTGGVAIEAAAFAGAAGKATIDATNVIARGGPGGAGLMARTDSSGAQAAITRTHTNISGYSLVGIGAAIIEGGGNQSSAPSFVNAVAGDYRQAAESITIGAGVNDATNGAFDVDGDPRVIGTTDIGADEFVPAPTPTSSPPTPTSPSTSPTSTTQTHAATPAFAGVKLVSTRLSFGGTFITLRLSCPAGTVGRCSGRTKLTARRRAGSGAAAAVTLGRASFSIAAGRQGKVKVRVSRAGRRMLSRVRRLRATDINAARDGVGRSKTTVAAVTIRRRDR